MASNRPTESQVSGLLIDGWRIPVTFSICLAAVAVYVVSLFGVDAIAPLALDPHGFFHRPWAPWTSALVHVGAIHLIFNLAWMWRFGGWIERHIGSVRMAGLCAVLALTSSAAEYAWDVGGVGLSGVVYGFFGLLWVRRRVRPQTVEVLDDRVVWLFVAWFFLCVAVTWLGWFPIGNTAHAAGALIGILAGCLWNVADRGRGFALASMSMMVVVCLAAATWARPWVNHGGGVRASLVADAQDAYMRGDLATVSKLGHQLVERDPADGWGHWYLGYAQVHMDEELLGLESLRHASRLGVRSSSPEQLWLSCMDDVVGKAARQENWDKVGRLSHAMLDVDARRASAWTWLGQCAFRAKDLETACDRFERAYAIEGKHNGCAENYAWAKATRAGLAWDAGRHEQAREFLLAGLAVTPADERLLELQRWMDKALAEMPPESR